MIGYMSMVYLLENVTDEEFKGTFSVDAYRTALSHPFSILVLVGFGGITFVIGLLGLIGLTRRR